MEDWSSTTLYSRDGARDLPAWAWKSWEGLAMLTDSSANVKYVQHAYEVCKQRKCLLEEFTNITLVKTVNLSSLPNWRSLYSTFLMSLKAHCCQALGGPESEDNTAADGVWKCFRMLSRLLELYECI